MKNFLIVLFFFLFAYTNTKAQDVKISRLEKEIVFDGSPFEEAWDGIESFPLVMYRPNFGADPSEKTEVFIGYDDEFLWVGARLYMTDASQIRATSKKRDETSRNSDSFGILLDSYNDNENAFAFFTMPTGLRLDYTVYNDASGAQSSSGGGGGGGGGSLGGGSTGGTIGGSTNSSWNAFWDVKTTRDDKGWYVEMRIPFSSLRFKPENNLATMGLIINRTISSKNETDTYPAIDPKYGQSGIRKPSLAQNIIFEGARPSKPVYVSPYLIGGYSRSWSLNPERTAYVWDDKPDYNAGLDVKYNLSSNMTLDLTVNTDFAQVEADNQQVNLTRYSLYFPEKRMFFQERASLFSFSLGGTSDLFYTRNIGMVDGQPVRIYGGSRIVGRAGQWDIGLIDMQTEEYKANPSENFGIFRLRRNVLNENSYLGGIFTSRLGMDGNYNLAYGVDGIFRVFGLDYLDMKFSQTFDSDTTNDIAANDPVFFSANWERRSEEGFAYQLGYSYTGQEFNPGIGFVRQGSMHNISGQLLYGWVPGAESKIFSHNANVRFERLIRLEDGGLESMVVEPGWEISTRKSYRWQIGLQYQEEGLLRDYTVSGDIKVPVGTYKFFNGSLRLSTPTSKRIWAMVNANVGQFYDGERYTVSFTPYFNISSSFQLSGYYQINYVRFSQRDQDVDIHSASLRATYMLNTKLSASLFVQYASNTDDLVGNFRLRYNPREGNDFYLVVNEYRGIDDGTRIIEMPDYYNQAIMLKYTHTFTF